jgi:acetylornithine deacetylase/succinyl-diaminopimelate desuccinylase-like protein
MLAPGLRNSVNPTMLAAGGKVNVVPGHAVAHLDGRFLPGHEEELLATVRELAGPQVQVSHLHRDVALEAPFGVPLTDAMAAALLEVDPLAVAVPFLMSGGTDGKAFSRLGIRAYGFAPLRLPAGLDFAALFHGVDERVPVDALEFGAGVLESFLRRC